MFSRLTDNNRIAGVAAFCGFLLLATAWPLARDMPGWYSHATYVDSLAIWITAYAFIVARLARAHCFTWRTGLVMLVLSLGVFSPHITTPVIALPGYQVLAAQSLSLAGMALLFYGLIRCAWLHPALTRLNALLQRIGRMPAWAFTGGLCAAFLLMTVFLSWYCFSFLPALCDTIGQYINAKFMARGHITWPAPPINDFFPSSWKVVTDGRWYTQYQPLNMLLLALGHVIHAPWLANPAEGAVTLWAIYAATRRICDEATARLAALFTLGSPMVLFMSAEYMNHACALMCASLFFLCYAGALDARERQAAFAWRWALGAGLSLGGIFLSRPFTTIEVGTPFILYSLYLSCRNPRLYFPLFLTMAAGGILCLLFQGWYDVQTTGNLLRMPYADAMRQMAGFAEGYTFKEAVAKAQNEWRVMNVSLFEWDFPCAFFVMAACLFPLRSRYLRLLLAMAVSVFALNMLNHDEYFQFGPRYVYESALPLIILTAVGIRRVPDWLQSWNRTAPAGAYPGMVALSVLVLFSGGFAWRMPENARMYSDHYDFNHPDFYLSMLAQSEKPALVFIEPSQVDSPFAKYWWVDYTNPPENDSPIIFAFDLGPRRDRRLMNYYPERHAYRERGGPLNPIADQDSRALP